MKNPINQVTQKVDGKKTNIFAPIFAAGAVALYAIGFDRINDIPLYLVYFIVNYNVLSITKRSATRKVENQIKLQQVRRYYNA